MESRTEESKSNAKELTIPPGPKTRRLLAKIQARGDSDRKKARKSPSFTIANLLEEINTGKYGIAAEEMKDFIERNRTTIISAFGLQPDPLHLEKQPLVGETYSMKKKLMKKYSDEIEIKKNGGTHMEDGTAIVQYFADE